MMCIRVGKMLKYAEEEGFFFDQERSDADQVWPRYSWAAAFQMGQALSLRHANVGQRGCILGFSYWKMEHRSKLV